MSEEPQEPQKENIDTKHKSGQKVLKDEQCNQHDNIPKISHPSQLARQLKIYKMKTTNPLNVLPFLKKND